MSRKNIKYMYSEYLIKLADTNPSVSGRASLVHELIRSYGILNHLKTLEPVSCSFTAIRKFHSESYVEHLTGAVKNYQLKTKANGDNDVADDDDSDWNQSLNGSIAEEFGLGYDCPVWATLPQYACVIGGATMTACDILSKSTHTGTNAEIIINWTGGWHHAHHNKAAGYCYINDIVLGIMLLRRRFKRVLYIDLDVHHGDGVQEAFEACERVFTLSFHKYECGFYPGTGSSDDCGKLAGQGYTANFPYQSGLKGDTFIKYFNRITSNVFKCYQPEACVVQCGADAIVGDPLGGTNLTPDDLIACITMALEYNLPTLLLGGGGYNFTNTSRYWTQITASLCSQLLNEDIPEDNRHFLKYGPDYSLKINRIAAMEDMNKTDVLEKNAKLIEDNIIKYNVSAV